MLIFVQKNGYVTPYIKYETLKDGSIALFAERKDEMNYIIKCNPEEKQSLPAIYDIKHGPMTNETFAKNKVPVKVIIAADANSRDDFEKQVQLLR